MPSLRDIPLVPGGGPLGHSRFFQADRLPFFGRIAQTGDLARIRFYTRDVLFGNEPGVAHELLVEKAKSFAKSPGIRLLLHYVGGRGLFTSEGELWRRQRRLMAPVFQPQAIGTYARVMHDVAQRVVSELGDGAEIDLARETTRIAMGVVGKALFNNDTLSEADELGAALTTALGWIGVSAASGRLLLHVGALDWLDRVAPHVPNVLATRHARLRAMFEEPFLVRAARGATHQAAIARLNCKVQAMIDERRRSPGANDDLLARLLVTRDSEDAGLAGAGAGADADAGVAMSDKQVRDEVVTLFVAGHETTATALAWSFYLLARHPEWRDRVQAEVDALPPGPIAFSQAAQLDATLRVFKEAMRLYPPVEVIARRSIEPVTLGGIDLPERSIVFVSPWIVHRHAPTWPDPERFDPDRFLPENEQMRPRSAWLPFGAGPRVCIGNHFAMLEGPIVLATMMRAARFEIDETRVIEPETFATLRPKGGVPAVVRLRA